MLLYHFRASTLEMAITRTCSFSILDSGGAANQRLILAGAVKLRHIADAAGLGFHDKERVVSLMDLKSHHHTRSILNTWTETLTVGEQNALLDYFSRTEIPDCTDPFSDLGLILKRMNLHG